MNRAQKRPNDPSTCEVIDFDAALLKACPPDEKADLMIEARILAQVFSTDGGDGALEEMAQTLSTGFRDSEMERSHARKLSAALKCLAKESPDGA